MRQREGAWIRCSDHTALSPHSLIVPDGSDNVTRDERSQLIRVCLEVDEVQMRIHTQDTSETNRLHNSCDVAGFNPYLDGMLLEVTLA